MPWRKRSSVEDTLCGGTHYVAFGVAAALTVVSFIIATSPACKIFFMCSMLVFLASIAYHWMPRKYPEWKDTARHIDVAMIYLMVPATVTALLPTMASVLFWVYAGLMAIGVVTQVIKMQDSDKLLPFFCFVVAWVCTVMIPPVHLYVGLLVYLIGLVFYLTDHKTWHHLLWHIFVMGAWSFHAVMHLTQS